jgi:hypothetical protein
VLYGFRHIGRRDPFDSGSRLAATAKGVVRRRGAALRRESPPFCE